MDDLLGETVQVQTDRYTLTGTLVKGFGGTYKILAWGSVPWLEFAPTDVESVKGYIITLKKGATK